ncbi:MmgE/PrpD family protein [Paraburkholderia sp. J8-2]|uniref:MmgE/PrpD family protein n=1 Tax=Paraburkholderia sp. J8-2 TaxID=2805440 RepID=UPI002AB6160C|nr:MmgE/PrpD family protein [Paraburkholderia sp. J8-2]
MTEHALIAAALPLARRIAAFDARKATPHARAATRDAIIETVGALMSGAGSPAAQRPAHTSGALAEDGPCLVAGTARRTTALDAALANGAAAAAGQQGASTDNGEAHAARFAALFALAGARRLSGERFHAAWLAGEAAAQGLASAAPNLAPMLATTLATVAAASHLLRFDASTTAAALALAPGAMMMDEADFAAAAPDEALKAPLRAGRCARVALHTVALAEQGETAGPTPHGPLTDTLTDALTRAADAFGEPRHGPSSAAPPAHHDRCDAFVARCIATIGASEALALYERLEAIDEASDIALLGTLMARRTLPGADAASAPLALSTTPGDGSDETAWVP